MVIDSLASAHKRLSVSEQDPVPLSRQVSSVAAPSTAYDANTEAFYQALIQSGPEFDAYAFLKQFVDADGKRPFRTSGPQLTALQQVMARLKEEGSEGEPAYAVARAAFSKAFSMNFMVQGFMNTALSASDDEDSRENVEW